MTRESFENRAQGNGEGHKELSKPEIVVKDVFSFEFRKGISFREWDDLQAIIKVPQEMSQRKKNRLEKMLRNAKEEIYANGQINLGDTEVLGQPQYYTKIVLDQTQEPPLYILTLPFRRDEKSIATNIGKEMGYDSSYAGIVLQLDPSTNNLHVDFDQIISTLREAGVSTSASGKELIDHFERVVKQEASDYDIEDEDERKEAYATYVKGNRGGILLAQQEGLDVYLGLGEEIKHRLLNFKSGDDLDISRTTLVLPLLSNHPQASSETKRIEFGMILPAIDITVAPSSKKGKIDDAPPNFDPGILAAGRDLTARIVTAFEALRPKT